MEAAGTIAALPTDEKTLSNEQYRKRNYKIGDKVAAVSRDLLLSAKNLFQ